ncbi:hypothetical protein [Puia dinghuensis]|uniref:Uncharacterized protein n=1 Tax=Puia dinghuensis TaxID=1792502 RepID=A0A8J2U8Z5_9BACT|nr:hypothetical protein [Puia dinghuensis]GGA87686.1 hypothetical protein GCM10011511_08570 [Puia dinghuensis]
MLINNKPVSLLFLSVAVLCSCTKQHGFGPDYTDYNPAQTPIIVTNAVDYRPDPTVTTSLSGDSSITITLSLTGNSGRSLKQITEVIGSTSYAAIQNPNSKFYNAAPIPATNNSVTFQTSIREYFQHYPVSVANPKATANAELTNRFYFQITLDDGSVVYPTPVRVLVLQ